MEEKTLEIIHFFLFQRILIKWDKKILEIEYTENDKSNTIIFERT